jgi:hypothetical protein
VKHLPAWFPGAGFQKEAQEGRVLGEKICKLSLEMVERRMVITHPYSCDIIFIKLMFGSGNWRLCPLFHFFAAGEERQSRALGRWKSCCSDHILW